MSTHLNLAHIATTAFGDQKPGTSGLRKPTKVFTASPSYLDNFVQATFDALRAQTGTTAAIAPFPSVLVVGGDGRFYGVEATRRILALAAGNGVGHVIVGHGGLLSTPAVSALVRRHPARPQGAFILTASHNPGGPAGDFGIKYNIANGGPATETITEAIFAATKVISELHTVAPAAAFDDFDLAAIGTTEFTTVDEASGAKAPFRVTVVDSVDDYAALMQSEFDFGLIKARLFSRPDFSFAFDAMSGVAGPYARRIFVDLLGASEGSVMNCVPSPDFDNGHPDPNLTYAPDLVRRMGLNALGQPLSGIDITACPVLGAAADGDADRNMVLGRGFFVTPSDSLAVLAANAHAIPSIARRGGLKAVARSMPTSSAVDAVAKALNLELFEVPTGWKFFGNLMDAGLLHGLGARGRLTSDPAVAPTLTPLLCGEESFGTGSDHVREKDGIWAILAWLSVLASANPDATKPLVHVGDIVRAHWRRFGRCYYTRYDYEGVESAAAEGMMAYLRAAAADTNAVAALAFEYPGNTPVHVSTFDDFSYTDPIDAAVSSKQGVRVILADGARVIFRLSGTGSSGATIRMYLERPMPAVQVAALADSGAPMPSTADYMAPLVHFALQLSQLQSRTGRDAPTVIT